MKNKEFQEAADKFQSVINGYHSIIKIKRRERGPADVTTTPRMITFEAIVEGVESDVFLDESSWNVTKYFIQTCNKHTHKIFGSKLNWNNTRTILWIYNEEQKK